jgi:hypothetical protein
MNEPSPEDIAASVAAPVPPVPQSRVNRLVRVLQGRKLKYTTYVLFRNGLEVEFQCDEQCHSEHLSELRSEVLTVKGFTEKETLMIPWADVLVFRQESNPE